MRISAVQLQVCHEGFSSFYHQGLTVAGVGRYANISPNIAGAGWWYAAVRWRIAGIIEAGW